MEFDTNYSPPETLLPIDDEEIHAKMLEDLPPDIDKTDGGFAYDFTRPAAILAADIMLSLNETVQIFFSEWSYGPWLDQLAQDAGLTRREANSASGRIQVTGTAGTTIPQGFEFSTASTGDEENISFKTTVECVLGEGVSEIAIQCTVGGIIGNVPANSIVLMVSPLDGISTISNSSPMTGGADEEDDDTLRERIQERNKGIDSSYAGSPLDYKRWAKEVSGVGDAVVLPEWEGPGTGTVKLIVVDQEGLPANEAILSAVYDHIIAPNNEDERLAPIGAILTVSPPSTVTIGISSTVNITEEANLEEITRAFKESVNAYANEAAEDGVIRYSRVGRLLSSIPGVVDYSNLLLNNGTHNVIIPKGSYPVIEEVYLNV